MYLIMNNWHPIAFVSIVVSSIIIALIFARNWSDPSPGMNYLIFALLLNLTVNCINLLISRRRRRALQHENPATTLSPEDTWHVNSMR